MKKAIGAATLIAAVSAVALVFPAFAKDIPQGLEDRGPLSKVTFIHYKKAHAKPPQAAKPPKASACYKFLASGAKWKKVEPYLVNPTNPDGVSDNDVLAAVNAGVAEWEAYGGNIFGSGSKNTTVTYDGDNWDEINSASFGVYPDPNVIAVTTVWGYFFGPPQTRELVEWDMLFNTDSDWTWGNAAVYNKKMDVENIAVHELGHSAGMADVYETNCNLETEYGYSNVGETIKRDLNTGDIAGIRKLYQ